MKIAIINNLYKPYTRGGSERVIELAVEKLKQEHQVFLITTQPEDVKDDSVNGNFRICRYNPFNLYYLLDDYKMPSWKKMIWHFYDLLNCKIAKQVKNDLLNYKPDVVITHNLKGLGYQIFKVIRQLKIPWIQYLHDYQLIDPHGSLYRQGQNLAQIGPILWLYCQITKMLVNSPKMVISPSKYVLDKHLKYGFFKKSQVLVLPNPIALENNQFITQKTNQLTLLYLGQIEQHKGMEFLVKTFINWKEANCRLLIVGEGSQSEMINGLSKEDKRIKVFGKVDHQQISQIFNQSNILIVPSIWWENSPTVIYEAYANQIPVLVSDSGGSKELIKEGSTGWIFKSNDGNDLIKKLNHINIIKEDLEDYGQRGYEFVKQFSVDNYVKRLIKLCQSLRK